MEVPTRYQWDEDSRYPLPDPGTAPGNCGITCVTVAEMFYNDGAAGTPNWHGIYQNRRMVTASLELSSTIGDQSLILWKRNVPNVLDKPTITGLHNIMANRLKPVVLGLDFSRVPLDVAGHPFRGSHSIMLRGNAIGGFTYLDPNFNRTYRQDPQHGYRFMPDWVLYNAYYAVPTQWALVPQKDKLLPSLPDTALPGSPDRADGDPYPMRYRSLVNETDHQLDPRTMRPQKPIRKGPLTSAGVWKTTGWQQQTIHPWGVIDKSDLPENERQYGNVLLINVYEGNGHHVGYVKTGDLAE